MSTSVDIPVGTRPLLIQATAFTAGNIQKVTVTDNQGFNVEWRGSASGTVVILGSTVLKRTAAKTYTVTITNSSDNGATFKASTVKNAIKFTDDKLIVFVVKSEDVVAGGDGDYDDAIVQFTYTNL